MTTPPPSLDEQVAAHAREQRQDDERLEALAAGRLTSAERQELERRASDDPELRAALELCQPLDEDARARIIDGTSATPSKVVSLRARAARRWVTTGLALAAALGATVLLPRLLQGRSSAQYTLEVSGDAEMRGAAREGLVKVSRLSHLTMVARPVRAVGAPPTARVFVTTASGPERRAIDVAPEISPDGAVRFVVEGARLGSLGPCVVTLVIGEGARAATLEAQVELVP
jgi:hypothetical protein